MVNLQDISREGVAIAGILLVGVILGGVVLADLQGPEEKEDPMSLNMIPNSSDIVVHFDSGVIDDPTTKKIMNHALSKSPTTETESYEDILQNASNGSEINWREVETVTMFGELPNETTTESTDYFGVIVKSSLTEERILEYINNESTESEPLREMTYKGKTLYMSNESSAESEEVTAGFAFLDGKILFGTEQALKDSVDTHQGTAAELSGPLRSHLENEEQGYIVFAMDVTESSSYAQDTQYLNGSQVISGAYYAENGDTIGLVTSLETNNTEDANTLKRQIDGGIALIGPELGNETLQNHINNINVTQSERTVSIRYEASVSEVNNLVDYGYSQALGGGMGVSPTTGGTSVEDLPQAGVTFDENTRENAVDIQAISMENADSLRIEVIGDASVSETFANPTEVGDVATVTGKSGDSGTIMVYATVNGEESLIQSFRYEF